MSTSSDSRTDLFLEILAPFAFPDFTSWMVLRKWRELEHKMTHQWGLTTETIIQLQLGQESKHMTKIIAFYDRLEFDCLNYLGK